MDWVMKTERLLLHHMDSLAGKEASEEKAFNRKIQEKNMQTIGKTSSELMVTSI